MAGRNSQSPVDGRVVLGVGLIVLGVVMLGLRIADLDPFGLFGGSGWTLLIIVPGIALIVASLVIPGAGLPLGIAGSVTTTVGLLLLYQDAADHYESWAYAWALLAPGAIGLGMVIHGLRAGDRDLLANGLRTLAAGIAIFAAGAVFFEVVIFRSRRLPFDLGEAWPVVIVAIGVVLIVLGLAGGRGPQQGRPAGSA